MNYTAKQINNAKIAYSNFLKLETAKDQSCFSVNPFEAERRAEDHNNIVSKINSGDKALEREWKIFFCNEELKKEQKENESKAKLQANKNASSDILAPIKELRKLGAFGKWLNNASNKFRKQHFSKKYTSEAVNAFLATL